MSGHGGFSGLGGGKGDTGDKTELQTYRVIFIRPDGKPQVWVVKAKSKDEAQRKADKYGKEEGYKDRHSQPYTEEEWKNRPGNKGNKK